MLRKNYLVSAVVSLIKTIPEVVADLGGSDSIVGFETLFGDPDQPQGIARALTSMPGPGILVAYERRFGASFDGSTLFKHSIIVYLRAPDGVSLEDFEDDLQRGTPAGQWSNIRNINIVPEVDPMDPPGFDRITDADGLDVGVTRFILPEIGDT